MFAKSVSLVLLMLSLGSLVGCSSQVVDKPVDTVKPPNTVPAGAKSASTSAITATKTAKPATTGTLPIVPAGIQINTDLQQELSTGKNRNNDKFTIKVKNGSVGKYPALKDAIISGHLEGVTKAAKGKKAKMNLFFDSVKLKNGDLLPLDATLVNTRVETKTKGQFLKNAGIILGGAIAGNFIGDKTQFKNGKLAGAAAATAFVLSSPGGEVVLKKGTDLQLKLKSKLDPN